MKKPINKFLTELRQHKPPNLLFVSIGNPSPKYDGTRHNAGHRALDYFTEHLGGLAVENSYRDTAISMAPLRDFPRVHVAKSLGYMNTSGQAVRAAVKHLGIDRCRLVVVHDDIDTEVGQCRFKLESTQVGGHGGLKDIVRLHPQAFARLRVGIGAPESRALGDVATYVLKKMTPRERTEFETRTLPEALDMARELVGAMS